MKSGSSFTRRDFVRGISAISAAGWIAKFLTQFNETDLFEPFQGELDFYRQLRHTGFIYGVSVETLISSPVSSLDLTQVELARQVRQAMPEAVGIFILPPSRAVLEQRLRGRGQDGDEVLEGVRPEALEQLAHALALQLEHARRIPTGKELVGRLVLEIEVKKVRRRFAVFGDPFEGVVDGQPGDRLRIR